MKNMIKDEKSLQIEKNIMFVHMVVKQMKEMAKQLLVY